jgi:membrane protein
MKSVRLILRHLPYLLRRTFLASFDDGLWSLAKGAAYSALLSFFPVLASAAAILVQVKAEFVQEYLEKFLATVLPPGTEDVVTYQFTSMGQRPFTVLVIAALLSLWAASSVVKSLIDGFNAAYRVPRNRSVVGHIGMGLMLVIFAVIPLIGTSSLLLFGEQIESWVLNLMKVDPILNPLAPWWAMFWRLMRYVVTFGGMVSLTGILYYYGPYRKQRWAGVWPGAILATLLWWAATYGFGYYVRKFANYNVLYGGVATSIALLSWMYMVAAIALIGCEFNAEAERMQVALDAQRAV